jgi:hypothetical protein
MVRLADGLGDARHWTAERLGRIANDEAERPRAKANEAVAAARRIESIDDEDTSEPGAAA